MRSGSSPMAWVLAEYQARQAVSICSSVASAVRWWWAMDHRVSPVCTSTASGDGVAALLASGLVGTVAVAPEVVVPEAIPDVVVSGVDAPAGALARGMDAVPAVGSMDVG